jgi:NADH:ubiquinone oxidoreductase subunit C
VNIELVLETLSAICPSERLTLHAIPIDDHVVTLPSHCLRRAVVLLLERLGMYHLSAITGQDLEGEIELLYHFWDGQGLTLRTSVSHDHAHIDTLVGLIPGAAYYEREVSEMLKVTFDGHPGPERLLLPDDWDAGAPLRNAFTLDLDKKESP